MQLTPVNLEKFIEAGRGTRLGAQWPGQRCLAKTRQGTPCQNPAIRGPNKCRLHGGMSSGPKTLEGKARVIAANTTHGRRSRAHIVRVRQINIRLRRVLNAMRRQGFIT
jgi:hypothetical protein